MIRIGRCTYDKKFDRTDPEFSNFTQIIVLMKSSAYGSLGPYLLKNEKGQIMENIWQFSKIYATVPISLQRYSRYDPTIIWEQDAETHIDKGNLTEEYWQWRKRGLNNEYPVRYPLGFGKQHNCSGAYYNEINSLENDEPFKNIDITNSSVICQTIEEDTFKIKNLNYIQGRKIIYLPVYTELVKKERQFKELQKRLKKGENLLIIEVDGPHQESLGYYKQNYGVADNFIENNTMLATGENIKIMLNDVKHPFGHGYCLAMTLLDKEKEWNI